ncbi:hypothetical protein [Thermomonospora umbrina]|uniref:hypothetical protein n=1 Tax=Thermomonospora umbrina TaxID=111806 RepID=UPI0011C181A7|nr:hypothetical protein [Thermomonospora umbrina]
MADEEEIKRELARLARAGIEPIKLIRWLRLELGEQFSEFSFCRYFIEVFDVPLFNVRRASSWVGLPYGAYLSDEEVNAMLMPLRVRGD